jgi:hypothetical protein
MQGTKTIPDDVVIKIVLIIIHIIEKIVPQSVVHSEEDKEKTIQQM